MSNTIHVPDTEEIHRIAYLTVHGWEYNEYGGWTKDGFTRVALDRHDREYEETSHALETAYYAQYEAAP